MFKRFQKVAESKISRYDWLGFPELFTSLVILCIVIGVIGNMSFCYFFGDSKTRIYKSRDALYFRRMAFFDMLVCVIVLPYSICYESRLIHNSTLCKIMELIRHVIVYMSHMILAAYSFELPRRLTYVEVHTTVNRMTVCCMLLASIFSLPTLFLFDVGAGPNSKGESKVPSRSCHLVVTFGHEPENSSVSLLRVHYFAVICLSYAVALVLFIFKTMHYCERLSVPGRRSVGVQLIERAQIRQLKTLDNDMWRHRVRRHSQTGRPVIFAEYFIQTSSDISSDGLETNRDGYQETPVCNTEKIAEVASGNMSVPRSGSMQNDSWETLDPVERERRSSLGYQRKDSLTLKSALKLKSELEMGTPRYIHDSYAASTCSPSEISIISKASSFVKKTQSFFVIPEVQKPQRSRLDSLMQRCFHEQTRKQSILKHRSSMGHLRMESYKQQLVCLILLDFIFILTAAIAYLILEEHGVILNLIHTKSIISFYLVSLTHPGLRQAVRRNIIHYCFKAKKPQDEVKCESTEAK